MKSISKVVGMSVVVLILSIGSFLVVTSYPRIVYGQESDEFSSPTVGSADELESLTAGSELSNTSSMNPDLGLNLEYPQGWSWNPGHYTTLYPPENETAFLSIGENPFPGLYKDLESLADKDITDFKGNGTLSTVQKTSNTISGNPALTLHFNFKYSVESTFSEYQITYINFGDIKDRFYKFEYYAVDNETFLKYLSDVNNVITSASLLTQ